MDCALSPITVPGVQDGTDYWLRVKATNLIADVNTGTGAESTAGVQLMSGVPDAPTGVYGVSQDSEVALTWVAPVDTGGSAVLHYTIYTTPAIDSSCGDGDTATCESYSTVSGVTRTLRAVGMRLCRTPHCSVRCSMVVADIAVTATVSGLTNGVWYRLR